MGRADGVGFAPFLGATAVGVTPQAFLYAYLIREAPQTAWAFYALSWGLLAIIGLVAIARVKRQGQIAVRSTRQSETALDGSSLPRGAPPARIEPRPWVMR